MPLNVRIQTQYGIEMDTYAVITDFSSSGKDVVLRVSFFANKNSFEECKKELDMKDYIFTPDLFSLTENVIDQAYNYLKTLDEFKNAVDC